MLSSLVANLDEGSWRRKPASGNWSILEIVCHLRDEEREDFGARLRSVLDDPAKPWPKIDPVAVVTERKYNEQSPEIALKEFLSERKATIVWLDSLTDVNWDQAYQHPTVGPVPAGLLLASWAAHDLLHLRQITKRLFESIESVSLPYPIDYAGSWQES
ncbi:MAG: DinB family protein [Pirellulaceae bacterium]